MTFTEDYRAHFHETYAGSEQEFTQYLVAYEFGRTKGLLPHYRGRSFADAEKDLRAEFEVAYPGLSFAAASEAIRYGFVLTEAIRSGDKTDVIEKEGNPLTGLDRAQIRSGEHVQSAEEVSDTGKSMSSGKPQPGTPRGGSGGPK